MTRLARYASDPAQSLGRLHGGSESKAGPRDAFQRDRDRIIHSIPFRRLRQKTQVFVAPDGDHFRVRLTHSLEVAQIGRTLARTLRLNEDLTEALCLAHDIGHPPFGHSGEEALQRAMANSEFDHNAHTLRLLTKLEIAYPLHAGLNLSWETLEGLAKHNGPVPAPGWALREADAEFPLHLSTWPSLEAQIAAIADDVAYDNHDIDDGLRAGLISLNDLLGVPLLAQSWEASRQRFPQVEDDRLLPEMIRDLIGRMVDDIVQETGRRIAVSGVKTADDVREAGRPLVGFSTEMAEQEQLVKAFLWQHMYQSPTVKAVSDEAGRIISELFAAYREDQTLLPAQRRAASGDSTMLLRQIGDFMAGMTDRYAIAQYRRHVGPVELPELF